MSQPRSRILIGLCLVVAATLVGGALGEKLPAGADRDMPSLDEYADILTTLSDWAPEAVAPDNPETLAKHEQALAAKPNPDWEAKTVGKSALRWCSPRYIRDSAMARGSR